jgi:hypothetical protein
MTAVKIVQLKGEYRSRKRRQAWQSLYLGTVVTEEERELARRACARGVIRSGMSVDDLREIFDALDLGKRGEVKVRCSRDGRYMRRLTTTDDWYMCTNGCKEIRHGVGSNFGLMLLGFCYKASK